MPPLPEAVQSVAADAAAAAERISPHRRTTPCVAAPELRAELMLKLENEQTTGSFKLRGALNRILTLPDDVRARGVLAASTGNHGAAVAHAASLVGSTATIYAPRTAAPAKLDKMRARGAAVELVGEECLESELAARAEAEASGRAYVSPYNDPTVVAGQGTVGVELRAQAPGARRVFVSVGGGGLIGGIGAVLKSADPQVEVIGCSPRASRAMAASWEAGRSVEVEHLPTLSDGTAGGLEDDAVTLPLCRAVVDRFVLVDEDDIADALRRLEAATGQRVEGAAGVALAAALADPDPCPSVVVICGGNLDPALAAQVFGEG